MPILSGFLDTDGNGIPNVDEPELGAVDPGRIIRTGLAGWRVVAAQLDRCDLGQFDLISMLLALAALGLLIHRRRSVLMGSPLVVMSTTLAAPAQADTTPMELVSYRVRLDQVVSTLKQHPTTQLTLSAHTDSRFDPTIRSKVSSPTGALIAIVREVDWHTTAEFRRIVLFPESAPKKPVCRCCCNRPGT